MNFWHILYILFCYLVGSIPTGLLVAKAWKSPVDIRSGGSGNIGATNVARLLGKKAGAITLLGDVFKGFLVIILAKLFFPDFTYTICLSALAVLLGNCFSIFLGFTGGKGVAVTFGIFFALSPLIALIAVAIYAGVIYLTKVSAVGSLAAMASLLVMMPFSGLNALYYLLTLLIVALVGYRHKSNIRELLKSWKS